MGIERFTSTLDYSIVWCLSADNRADKTAQFSLSPFLKHTPVSHEDAKQYTLSMILQIPCELKTHLDMCVLSGV